MIRSELAQERVLLSLGSNVEPERHLQAAATAIRKRFPDARFSPVYRSAAIGFEGPDFLNAGAELGCDLSPEALNIWLRALEEALGRRRGQPRFASRTLDVDIVLFGHRIIKGPGCLELPRPELRFAFVLKPLVDLTPNAIEPTSGHSLAELWSRGTSATEFLLPHPLVL